MAHLCFINKALEYKLLCFLLSKLNLSNIFVLFRFALDNYVLSILNTLTV